MCIRASIYIAEPIADITASFTSLALFLSKRKTLLPAQNDAPVRPEGPSAEST